MSSIMHPNQIPTSPDLVRCLLNCQYPGLADEPVATEPLGGTDSAIYRVGESFCVRLPIVDWAVGKQSQIRHWLPWLNAKISSKVPIPAYYGTADCGYPHDWTIYPWIDGSTMQFGCNDPGVATEIALFLKEIRALPTQRAPSTGRSPHALDVDVRSGLDQLTSEDDRDELISIWNDMMQMPAWDGSDSVWMHGDVAPDNLLFNAGRFVAAIDWTELGVGDPAIDLQVAWNFFGCKGRRVFRQEIHCDELVWVRARARAFAQASFQLPYYRESYPALASQAKYVFRQILKEY